jgi:hypothetical protein
MIDLGANLGASIADDEPDGRGVPNAVSIRFGQKSFTYRHGQRNNSAKNDLLMTFRKTVEDLRKNLRSEKEAAIKSGDGVSRNPSLSRNSDFFDNLNLSRDKLEVRIDVDGKQQNLRWVEGQLDELDISIALQRFEEAVSSVERLRKLVKGLKGNSIAQDVINFKVDQRARKLAETLCRALVDTHSFLNATKTNVSWLSRLGFDDCAREAYLQARTEIITKRARYFITSS